MGLAYTWLLLFPMPCDTPGCDPGISAYHWFAAAAILAGSVLALLGAARAVAKRNEP